MLKSFDKYNLIKDQGATCKTNKYTKSDLHITIGLEIGTNQTDDTRKSHDESYDFRPIKPKALSL